MCSALYDNSQSINLVGISVNLLTNFNLYKRQDCPGCFLYKSVYNLRYMNIFSLFIYECVIDCLNYTNLYKMQVIHYI